MDIWIVFTLFNFGRDIRRLWTQTESSAHARMVDALLIASGIRVQKDVVMAVWPSWQLQHQRPFYTHAVTYSPKQPN